jgi:hypothetical protein
MKATRSPARRLAARLLPLLFVPGLVQAVRDPMEPPATAPALRAPAETVVAAAAPPAPLPVVRHIVTVAGEHFVVVGARRHGAGDRLGDLRIECVHASGVVARDEIGVRRHLPLFGGVTVRPSTAIVAGNETGNVAGAEAGTAVRSHPAEAPVAANHSPGTPAGCAEPASKTSKRKSP